MAAAGHVGVSSDSIPTLVTGLAVKKLVAASEQSIVQAEHCVPDMAEMALCGPEQALGPAAGPLAADAAPLLLVVRSVAHS